MSGDDLAATPQELSGYVHLQSQKVLSHTKLMLIEFTARCRGAIDHLLLSACLQVRLSGG